MSAIRGTYSDLKFIRSRKVAQVVIEIPIEEAGQFTSLFGTPNPATETWVAMARLVEGAQKAEPPPSKERRRFSELPPAQQAALRCNEPAFWRFLNERKGYAAQSADDAAEAVRDWCGVESRSDLNIVQGSGRSRWHVLNGEFEVWMMPQ